MDGRIEGWMEACMDAWTHRLIYLFAWNGFCPKWRELFGFFLQFEAWALAPARCRSCALWSLDASAAAGRCCKVYGCATRFGVWALVRLQAARCLWQCEFWSLDGRASRGCRCRALMPVARGLQKHAFSCSSDWRLSSET